MLIFKELSTYEDMGKFLRVGECGMSSQDMDFEEEQLTQIAHVG